MNRKSIIALAVLALCSLVAIGLAQYERGWRGGGYRGDGYRGIPMLTEDAGRTIGFTRLVATRV